MRHVTKVFVPESEQSKLQQLESLFQEWHQHFSVGEAVSATHVADDMSFDGFYPYYFQQPRRLLFVGRESRRISGCNYIDLLYKAYRETKLIGGRPLNSDKFHSRMLYVAYGLTHEMPAWDTIPYASTIGDTFGTEKGLSFAFMNLSKFSNEGPHWSSNWEVINAVHARSTQQRRFIEEEVAILAPDVVIAMNLKDKTTALGTLTSIEQIGCIHAYWLDSGAHRSLLLDAWHFSAPRKKAQTDYYEPICEAIRRIESIQK